MSNEGIWNDNDRGKPGLLREVAVQMPLCPPQIKHFLQNKTGLIHYKSLENVAGSIPDGVIEIFHGRNLSGRTMALGLTQPLTEIITRNIS